MSMIITNKQRKGLIVAAIVELLGFISLVASVVYLNVAPDEVTHEVLFLLAVVLCILGAVGMVIAGQSKYLKSEAN